MNQDNESKLKEVSGMASVQLPLETDLDSKEDLSVNNTTVLKVDKNFESSVRKNLKCKGDFEDSINHKLDMLNEEAKPSKGILEASVDVTGSKRSSDTRVAAKEDPDVTECSSSFADTTSGDENCSRLSDNEVESNMYASDERLSSFFPVRKKKLTSHWRNFIRPLMWRCKWAELKIKELESQASKYRRKLASYEQKKLLALDQTRVEEFGSRSLPYMSQSRRKKPLKRRKRKITEYMTDTAAYMAHHNLFSYCENKRSEQDGTSACDDFGNQAFTAQNPTGSNLGAMGDFPIEGEKSNFQEQTLRKIELVQSRVHKMKAQLESLMTKYAGKFSSSESLTHLVPCDAQTSSGPGPTFSACNGDTVSVGGLYGSIPNMSDYDLADFVTPDAAVSGYGKAVLIPDIIESTVGLLSSVDVTQHQAQVGDLCEKIVDNILIHNEAAEIEMQNFKASFPDTLKQQVAETSGEHESTQPPLPSADTDKVVKVSPSQDQSSLKSCLPLEIHFPKSKRKRGERKGGAVGWSRQLPGEPDSP